MLNKLAPRERFLIIVLLIVVVGFLFYKYGIQGQILKQSELKATLLEQETILTEKKAVAGSYDQVAFESETAEKSLEKLRLHFKTNSTDGSREVKFGQDAKNDLVKVVLFQPLEVKINEHYLELPIKMEVQGKYYPILDFLISIEGFYNLTDIKDLNITSMEDLTSNPELKATFTFSIYTTNPPEESSSYADLTQWTVGRINSFSVGLRSIANWDSENPGTGSNDGTPGEDVQSGNEDGNNNNEDPNQEEPIILK